MSDQKTKPKKVPLNQAQLLKQYQAAYKKRRPTSLKEILQLRERFRAKGMAI